MGEKATSKKTRIFESNNIDDEPFFLDPKPLNMIVPLDISTDKSKYDGTKNNKKGKAFEKVSTFVHDTDETVNVDMEVESNPSKKNIDHGETMFEGQNVEPHVGQHVELNVEAFFLTFGCPYNELTSVPVGEPPESTDETHVKENLSVNPVMVDGHLVDTLVIDKLLDDVFNDNYVFSKYFVDDILNENHQNVEVVV